MYEALVFMCQIHNQTPPRQDPHGKTGIPLSVSLIFPVYMSTDLLEDVSEGEVSTSSALSLFNRKK